MKYLKTYENIVDKFEFNDPSFKYWVIYGPLSKVKNVLNLLALELRKDIVINAKIYIQLKSLINGLEGNI